MLTAIIRGRADFRRAPSLAKTTRLALSEIEEQRDS